jgi:hypothetical protein
MLKISDNNSPIISDYSKKSNTLIVTFGGIAQGIGIPVFEFFNILEKQDVNKIFIRDFAQAWYHKGLWNMTNDLIETANLLSKEIEKSGAERVIFFGNSSGGYAALLFGNLLSPDRVLCFSPQTFLSWHKRLFSLDFRWRKEIKKIYAKNSSQKDYLDLKNKFRENLNTKTQFFIHYCDTFRLDRIHAQELKNFEQISLIKHRKGDHGLIKLLKETGELENIINNALMFER